MEAGRGRTDLWRRRYTSSSESGRFRFPLPSPAAGAAISDRSALGEATAVFLTPVLICFFWISCDSAQREGGSRYRKHSRITGHLKKGETFMGLGSLSRQAQIPGFSNGRRFTSSQTEICKNLTDSVHTLVIRRKKTTRMQKWGRRNGT